MIKAGKYRVVIDTNLIISAIIAPTGLSYKLLKEWQDDQFVLVISLELIEEIKAVSERDYLKNKYHLFTEKMAYLLATLKLSAEVAIPLPFDKLSIHCRDPKDDILLALAIGGTADYLVTGDSDLLILNGKSELGKLKITTARKFLSL